MTELLKEQIRILQEVAIIRDNSELLMDTLVNLLSNVVGFCHKNNIPIEDEISINMMLRQTRTILQNLQGCISSPKHEHPFRTPEDGTEPKSFLIIFFFMSLQSVHSTSTKVSKQVISISYPFFVIV
jgi:hypothetical protein